MASTECAFCGIVSGAVATEIIYESPENLAILAKPPTPAGHSIILPKRHVVNFAELSPEEQAEFAKTWGLVELALITLLKKPRVINLKSGGFVNHLHLHLYPAESDTAWPEIIGMFENRVNTTQDPADRQNLLSNLRRLLQPSAG